MGLYPGGFTQLANDVVAAQTVLYDANGNQLSGFDSSRPATSVHTVVTQTITASTTLLALNAARRQYKIFNNASKILYVTEGATATTSAFSYQIPAFGFSESVLNGYTGIITGTWSTAGAGNAQITEIST